MVTRRKDAVGLQRKVAAQSGKRGQKGTRRIYRKKGVLVKGLKADAQKKAIRRNIVLNHRRGKKPQLVGGSTGLPVSKSRIRRAMRPDNTMALYYSSSKKYNPLRPLATVRSGRCFDADRKMRVGKKGSLTCRIKPKAPKRAKRARRSGSLSPYQQSAKSTLLKLRGTTIPQTRRMRIAGAVWRFQRDQGMSHGAAFDQAMMAYRGMAPSYASRFGAPKAAAPKRRRAAPKGRRAPAVQSSYGLRRRR